MPTRIAHRTATLSHFVPCIHAREGRPALDSTYGAEGGVRLARTPTGAVIVAGTGERRRYRLGSAWQAGPTI